MIILISLTMPFFVCVGLRSDGLWLSLFDMAWLITVAGWEPGSCQLFLFLILTGKDRIQNSRKEGGIHYSLRSVVCYATSSMNSSF